MKTLTLFLTFFVTAFLYTGCNDATITTEESIVSGDNFVPFKGNWEGMTKTLGYTERRIDCGGTCTHLGQFNATVLYNVAYNDPNFPPNPALGGTIANGGAVMTAANGDKLFLENLTGEWNVISNVNPMIEFTGSLTVNGGTGRFLNATGSISGSGTQNYYLDPFQDQEVWFNWDGTVNY